MSGGVAKAMAAARATETPVAIPKMMNMGVIGFFYFVEQIILENRKHKRPLPRPFANFKK